MTSLRSGAATLLGWLVVLGGLTAGLTTVGHPATSVLLYFGVWLASTTVPGVLVWRALARPTTLVQELGFGSVLGIALLLLAWLPASLANRPVLMGLWPVGVVVAFAAVPSLRRHWWPSRLEGGHTPGRWHAAMMLVCGVAFVRMYAMSLHVRPLPPTPSSNIHQDAWYQLALTHALGRSVALQDPSADGVSLNYHWFANAHAAATQVLSGVSMSDVVLHLWLVPMLVTLLFAVAAATERIVQDAGSGAATPGLWWAGPVAALLAGALPAAMFLGEPRLPDIDHGFIPSSLSGVLALVVVLAFVGPTLDILNGLAGRGTWLLLLVLLVFGAGTKPSVLPVVACGGLLVVIAQWVRTRVFPRTAAVLTLLPLLLVPVAAVTLFGSTDGSRIQFLQTLALDPAFDGVVGIDDVSLPGRGGWLAPDLAAGSPEVWAVALGLFTLFALTELPRLIGLAGPLAKTLRDDPGMWWSAGVVGSGFVGLWVLSHPGYSQHYFWRIVIPLSIVLTVAMIARLLPVSPGRGWPAVAVVSLAGIGTAAAISYPWPLVLPPEISYDVTDRLIPYAVAIAIVTVTILILRWWPDRRGWFRVPAVALAASFVCAAGATTAVYDVGRAVRLASESEPIAESRRALYVSGDEQRAALWLNAHSDEDDLVATNVFCVPVPYKPGCHHASFWVQGLTGRQLLVGGWAYTEENLAAYGRGGDVSYHRLESPWPDRVALSLRAVRFPSSEVVSELERRGVRWIFADRRATEVSPELEKFATLRFRNPDVLIYRLDR
jgi:hypothetical protein